MTSPLDLTRAQRKPCFWLSGNHFQHGSIDTTQIDMGNPDYNITNLHDPINAQDAATKQYIDRMIANLSNAVQSQYVILNGLDPTTIEMFPSRGSFTVWVSGTMVNGPSAAFTVTRSKSDEITQQAVEFTSGVIDILNQSGGVGSTDKAFIRLLLTWQTKTDQTTGVTTSQLLLSKISDNVADNHLYDGKYEIIYLGSDGQE